VRSNHSDRLNWVVSGPSTGACSDSEVAPIMRFGEQPVIIIPELSRLRVSTQSTKIAFPNQQRSVQPGVTGHLPSS